MAQTFLSATGEIISCTTNIYTGLDLVAEIQNGVRIDRQVNAFGRPKCLSIGPDYSVEYGFNEYGQFLSLQSVTSTATNLFSYSYLSGSHLLSGVSMSSFAARKTYEPNRDLITSVSNTFDTATISAFIYENDAFGRRTARTDVTPTLTVNNAFGYNFKSEVTSATMGENQYVYEYDPIGNRIYAAFNAETNDYSANALNQYTIITNSVGSVPPCLNSPSYDLDGNMLTNGVWSYTWDAENRLTAVYSNNTLLVSNTYDHQSRRIAKIISRSGAVAQRNMFVWNGWNLIQERITDNGSLTTNSYIWGIDLSGALQDAGGVGGLLAVQRDSAVFFPCFDANGNITEYIDAAGAIRVHYAFDAFGNTITQSGDLALAFFYRFSAKYFDDEAGLYYYGYRYYSSGLGRWVNRDPLEENGGINLFSSGNTWVCKYDPFGLKVEDVEILSPFTYVNKNPDIGSYSMYVGLWFDELGQLGVSYKYFYYRMVLKVEYGTCCKKEEKWEKNKVYDYSSDKIFYDDATLEWQGGQTLGKVLTAGGTTSALYLNPINTAEKFGGSNIKKGPWSPEKGTMELDGYSYGDISMEIDWVVSNTLAPGFSSVPNPWGDTIQWHDIGQKRTGTKLPDNDIVKKGHQTIKIKWECGDAKGWSDEGTDPKIEGGSDRNKNQEHMQKGT